MHPIPDYKHINNLMNPISFWMTGTLANSEDLDEIPHKVTFH